MMGLEVRQTEKLMSIFRFAAVRYWMMLGWNLIKKIPSIDLDKDGKNLFCTDGVWFREVSVYQLTSSFMA